MVRGCGIAVTAVPSTYQWAEITRMARGLGTLAPRLRQAVVKRLDSIAFIGLPWPRNAEGIREGVAMSERLYTSRHRPGRSSSVRTPRRWLVHRARIWASSHGGSTMRRFVP